MSKESDELRRIEAAMVAALSDEDEHERIIKEFRASEYCPDIYDFDERVEPL